MVPWSLSCLLASKSQNRSTKEGVLTVCEPGEQWHRSFQRNRGLAGCLIRSLDQTGYSRKQIATGDGAVPFFLTTHRETRVGLIWTYAGQKP
jgi:hypothetical protein